MKPIYTHDCDACTYLGQYEHEGTMYDLYFHGTHEGRSINTTVIARYGDDGPDYCSGLGFAERDIQPYKEALDRAVAKGLYNPQKQPVRMIGEAQMSAAQALGAAQDAMVKAWSASLQEGAGELYEHFLQVRMRSCDQDEEEERAEAKVYEALLHYAQVVRR